MSMTGILSFTGYRLLHCTLVQIRERSNSFKGNLQEGQAKIFSKSLLITA